MNFERNIRRKREQVLWQGWSRDFNLETLSRAGLLLGLQDLEFGRISWMSGPTVWVEWSGKRAVTGRRWGTWGWTSPICPHRP